MVDGLLAERLQRLRRRNVKQKSRFSPAILFRFRRRWSSISACLRRQLKKVAQTYSALDGSFGPFDKAAVFTYGNSVNKQSDFGNDQR